MIYSRRRRGRFTEADRALRAALGDAALVAWYDARFPATLDAAALGSWSDARGSSGYGPALSQSTTDNKPTYSAANRTVAFDGSNDSVGSTAAGWNTITAACAVVVVSTLMSTGGAVERLCTLGDASGSMLGLGRAASDGDVQAIAAGSSVTAAFSSSGLTGTRVFHGWKLAASGGNITAGVRVGSAAAVTASAAAADATATRFRLAVNAAANASFGDTTMKAALVIKGTYTTAMQNAVNEWARAVHGASI